MAEQPVNPSSAASQVSDGMVIRGTDGEIYFLRKELLEATRVTEREMREFLEEEINKHYPQDPTKFRVALGPISKVVPLRGPFEPPKFDAKAAGTVMCPGTSRRAAYIIPSERF